MIEPRVEADGPPSLSIVTIASAYPSPRLPHHNPFIHLVMSGIVALGNDVAVIAPRRFPRLALAPSHDERDGVQVRRPRYLSPGVARPWQQERLRLSHRSFTCAVRRAGAQLPPPDVVLGYFLRPAGAAAADLGERWGRPAFAMIGEGDIVGHNRVADDAENGALTRRLTGLITVNEATRSEVIERYQLDPSRVTMIPHGVDTSFFSPGDREAARRHLGLPADGFVVTFVGRLEHNKGSDRLAAAARGLDNVSVIFVGPGTLKRTEPNSRTVGPIAHDMVADYLKAADVFALPSLVEGRSNATVEAMASGLPVIVSDRDFNRAVVDDLAAVFVDPLDPVEIRRAIVGLRDDPARRAADGRGSPRTGQPTAQ